MLDLAYINLLDFLSRSPAGARIEEFRHSQLTPFSSDKTQRRKTKDDGDDLTQLSTDRVANTEDPERAYPR